MGMRSVLKTLYYLLTLTSYLFLLLLPLTLTSRLSLLSHLLTIPPSFIYSNLVYPKMPTRDRLHGRNINFFNGQTGEHLGGVLQNGSISNETFFDMLMYTLLDVDKQIIIRSRATGQSLPSDSNPLETGEYDIFCPGGKLHKNSMNITNRFV